MSIFTDSLKKTKEYGTIVNLNPPLYYAQGLPTVRLNEIIYGENGFVGYVIKIRPDFITILALNNYPANHEEKLARSDQEIQINVGEKLLGMVINPLGQSFFPESITPILSESRPIDSKPLGLTHRKKITRPFLTGVGIVDLLVPLGKGQRELIVGDRKTGKSAFVLTTALTQAKNNSIIIYACIGKKNSDILNIVEFFKENKITKQAVIIATSSACPLGLTHLAPLAATTIAEYFKDQGRDVTLILDDLSTHAKVHREIFLTAKFFPGRESYPGDIFHLHAKLLERAGSFINPVKGETAITCLPIAQTTESDLTGYITTNLMGMTDGHIFFDNQLFTLGRRPSVNIHLSVTRVGKQTRSGLQRKLHEELMKKLTLYETLRNYAHFGSELSSDIQEKINQGEEIYELFQQSTKEILTEETALAVWGMIYTRDKKNKSITELKNIFNQEKFKKKLFDILQTEDFDKYLLSVGNLKI